MGDDSGWLTVNEAAAILKMTARQVNRYGNTSRLRTHRAGRRVLYHAGDVAALANELRVDIRPAAAQHPLARPITDMADYVQRLAEAQQRVEESLRRLEESGARQLPGPQGATKEELREMLQEVLAAQERASAQREALRSREARKQNRILLAAVVILFIGLAVVIYIVAMR